MQSLQLCSTPAFLRAKVSKAAALSLGLLNFAAAPCPAACREDGPGGRQCLRLQASSGPVVGNSVLQNILTQVGGGGELCYACAPRGQQAGNSLHHAHH